jgi:nucleotide-binding universal stress UspA family protein
METVVETVMVVFSATQISDKIADYAIETAIEKKARLIVLDVREANMSGRVSRIMDDVSFLGRKVLDQLKEEIKEERGEMIIKALHGIRHRAEEKGVETEFIVVKGPYIDNILRIAKEKRVSTLIVQKRISAPFQEAPFEVIYVQDGMIKSPVKPKNAE